MFRTDAQVEFEKILKEFSAVTYDVYGSHSYASGYYESLMGTMFNSLSKRAQQELIRSMDGVVERQHQAMLAKNG